MNPESHDANSKKQVEELVQRLESGEVEVPIDELLTPEFLQTYSVYPNVNTMFASSGFLIENAADFARIPAKDWDEFIRSKSRFASWAEMTQAAGLFWAQRKIGG